MKKANKPKAKTEVGVKLKSEARIQSDSYQWFHNTHPNLRGLLCYNLNNPRNAVNGNQAKAMGLQKGRSDMVLYYNGTAFMFEFKDDKGRQAPAQKKWEAIIKAQGFEYYLIRTQKQFEAHIKKIIG